MVRTPPIVIVRTADENGRASPPAVALCCRPGARLRRQNGDRTPVVCFLQGERRSHHVSHPSRPNEPGLDSNCIAYRCDYP